MIPFRIGLMFVLAQTCTLLWCCLPCHAEEAISSTSIVDTHVHLWDLDRKEGIYWIAEGNKTLYRSYLPEHHQPIAQKNNVGAVVVVQAGQHLPDNQWNLDITADNPRLYRGVVGNLSEVIGTNQFQLHFEKLIQDKRYVGYRLSGRYQEGISEAFLRDLKQTAAAGKTVDFLVGKFTLEDVDHVATKVPKLKIIVDHLGGVRLDGRPLDKDWIAKFRKVAEHPNVHCKVSALFGRFKDQPAPKQLKQYQEILDLAYESFGEDRLIYGSDWPVSRMTDDYAAVITLTRSYFDSKGEQVSRKLFHDNAMRFYGIADD